MRRLSLAVILFLAFATVGSAKDVYLSIGGSVGAFRTDARIFNPSFTKDIQIQAYLLPLGVDNSGVAPKTITVPKRQMLVFDDVVSSLFNGSGLAGIRLKSDDDFIATSRVYSTASDGSTNGQFVAGVDAATAQKKGVVIQLKTNGGRGQARTFRTQVGALNPNAVAANVTWHVYDKANNAVGQAHSETLPPFGVKGPTALQAFADNLPANVDLSDAWLSYESDQPIFAYGSVVDNTNEAGTFIPMAADSGTPPPAQTPPGPQSTRTFNVTEKSYSITIAPPIGPNDLKPGDTVTFHITVHDSDHGLELIDPDGKDLIPAVIFRNGDVVDKTFTITKNGTYTYFCVNSSCGTAVGHNSMVGEFNVGNPSDPTRPGY